MVLRSIEGTILVINFSALRFFQQVQFCETSIIKPINNYSSDP